MHPLLKLAIEAGPLVVFFAVNAHFGIFRATAAFMAATLVALVLGWHLMRKLPIVPLVSGIFVLVFGGLTLILADELFIKVKPTIVNGLFAVTLLGGLGAGRSLLKPLFGSSFQLDEAGWRTLTLRWGLFFILMAVLNEVVWRNFSTDIWAGYKLFVAMPVTLAFALSQAPLIMRHQSQAKEPAAAD
ncbi:MAG: septation protein A [Alphaproteobacteria bacterium]